ncbi:MAG: MoxR family ATPase, partial [Lentisphaeria bacterium]|nr:MoxR family ATPase [Lentisphaeria bacterium]
QNPVEQEGTYPLPEAQVDRFMFKLKVSYPAPGEELLILRRMSVSKPDLGVSPVLEPGDVLRLRRLADDIYVDGKIEEYIVSLVTASRDPASHRLAEIADLIRYGASPRATIFLALAAKGHALLAGRGYVTPQDVKEVAMDVLRHRVIVTYEAEAEEKTSEDVVQKILDSVDVP